MVRYILQGCKTAIIGVLTGVCFTACTQDNLADTQGEILPEGKYPLELTVSGLDVVATPATRATVDDNWIGNEEVSVDNIYSSTLNGDEANCYKYRVDGSGNEVSLIMADVFGQIYWHKSDEKKIIRARYPYSPEPIEAWSVEREQGDIGMYQKGDLLYAYKIIPFEDRNREKLVFYHQTAKVVINIRFGTGVDGTKFYGVTINNTSLEGDFNQSKKIDKDNPYGLTVKPGASTSNITPHRLPTANTNLDFGSGISSQPADASYEALVIPQTVKKGISFITIDVGGTKYHYKAPDGNLELQAGTMHTFNITVKGTSLQVTTPKNITDWGTNSTNGNGTVGI